MKIIHVDKPMQDENTLEPQIIDGKRYSWVVKTESTKANESFLQWWKNKQEWMIAHSKGEKLVEGIFLYNIEGVGGLIGNEENKYPWVLHIRYAWIKVKKDEN